MPQDLPLSAQLYTVRDLTAKDFAGTVREIGRIGYAGVELAGFGNLTSAAEVRKACDDAGVKISANHVAIDAFEKDINKVLGDNAALGVTRLVVPWLAEDRRKDKADWLAFARSMDAIARQIRPRGYELLYHNHSFEFQTYDGTSALDLLFNNTDPALVKSELDVYWVAHGGHDPAAYIARLGRRCVALHLKDMAPGADRKFAPVGAGALDFRAILAAARAAGVASYVVEQDNCYGQSPLDSLRTSHRNLSQLAA